MINLNAIRRKIILEKGLYYFDFTASGLAYYDIEKKILNILKTYANIHSEFGYNAEKTDFLFKEALNNLYENLDIDKRKFYIIPTGTGSTGAIKKFQEIVGIYLPPETKKRIKIKEKRPLVLVGPYEHHSNEISYRESLAETVRLPIKDGEIDFDFMENILKKNQGREIYGSFSLASNVTGILTDYKRVSKLLRKYKAFVLFDAATYSPYKNIKSKYYDALFLSPHKLLGGPGSCGLLVISKKFINLKEKPTFSGGGVVDYVGPTKISYLNNFPDREMAGTPGILQLIRASEAYVLRNKIGLDFIEKKEKELVDYFFKKSKEIPGMIIYEKDSKNRLAIFSFNIENFNHHKLAKELSDKFGIQVRSGCSCAGPYGHYLLKIKENEKIKNNKPGWVRVSFSFIHQKKDIDYFFDALKKIINKISI